MTDNAASTLRFAEQKASAHDETNAPDIDPTVFARNINMTDNATPQTLKICRSIASIQHANRQHATLNPKDFAE
jgi:hypothetical protein